MPRRDTARPRTNTMAEAQTRYAQHGHLAHQRTIELGFNAARPFCFLEACARFHAVYRRGGG